MRPRVLLNCAASRDGFLAGPDGAPVRVSDDEDLRRVHALRAASDAILVGVGTVLADDPSLRVRSEYAQGDDPLRVVLDADLRTPPGARVLDGAAATCIYHATQDRRLGQARTVRVPRGDGGLDLHAVLRDLSNQKVGLLMVEGGARVLASFLRQGLWDEWTVYEAPIDLGDGPALPTPRQLREWGAAQTGAVARGAGWVRTYVPQ